MLISSCITAAVITLESSADGDGRQQTLCLQSQELSIRSRLQARLLKLFMQLFPWIHATQEGLRFGYQLLYLLDSTAFYMPTLHLLGQTVARVSGQEMVSLHFL